MSCVAITDASAVKDNTKRLRAGQSAIVMPALLRVRAEPRVPTGPLSSSNEWTRLGGRDEVTILELRNGWARVAGAALSSRRPDAAGTAVDAWVMAKFLMPASVASVEAARGGIVNADQLNVRVTPRTSPTREKDQSLLLTTKDRLMSGTHVTVLKSHTDKTGRVWYLVGGITRAHANVLGWVQGQFVNLQ